MLDVSPEPGLGELIGLPELAGVDSAFARGLLCWEVGCPNEAITVEGFPNAGTARVSEAVVVVTCPKREGVVVDCENGDGCEVCPNGPDVPGWPNPVDGWDVCPNPAFDGEGWPKAGSD
jgi:hypothetical protein